MSRELAVLEERRRSLITAQSSVLADQDRTSDEERVAYERLVEAEQEILRLQSEFEEAQGQVTEVQQTLQRKQAERAEVEEKLKTPCLGLDRWSSQRADTQARLEELHSRLESLQARLDQAGRAIENVLIHAQQAQERYEQARQAREAIEKSWQEAVTSETAQRNTIAALEQERRQKAEQRSHGLAEYTRLKAQLEVLEQAEESLAGYAEGARFLLDAARQSRLQGARGAV